MASITLNTDNVTPTPTTRDVLPLVRASLGIPQSQTQRDADLCYLAQLAVAKYSQMRPHIVRATLTTVMGQLSYPLPPQTRDVIDVAIPSQYGYYNDWLFLPMIDTPSSSLFGYSDYAFRSPSERVIRQEILTELDHYAKSFTNWYVEGDPPMLYVLPTSTAGGLPIIVKFAQDYINEGTDSDPKWTTLTAGHWNYVVRLIKWAMADMRADMLTSSMALSEQGGGNSQLTESWKLGNRAERILEQVRADMGIDVSVAVRS